MHEPGLEHVVAAPRVSELSSGIRVVTDTMPGARSVTTGVWVGVGSRDEDVADAGVSHFLEHLFFKGTSSRSARTIAEAIDAVGGELNAFTARERTAFHTRVPASEWRLGVEMLGDLLSDPLLAASDIDAEREVILEELWAALDTPDDLVHMLALESVFTEHALGREVLGSVDSISDMTRDQIVEFFERYYRPANLVVAAAGRVDHDEFCDEVAARFDLPAGGEAPLRTPPGPGLIPDVSRNRDGEQVHVVLSWRGLPQGHDDRYVMTVANQILGGGSASRLFQTIREDRALAYTVYSWSASYSDAGVVGLYAGTSPARASELRDALDVEIDRLVTDGVTADELRVAKGFLAGTTELGLEDSGSRMTRVGRMLSATGRVIGIDEQIARIRAVTSDDVDALIRRLLGERRSVAVVGPTDDDPDAAPALAVAPDSLSEV